MEGEDEDLIDRMVYAVESDEDEDFDLEDYSLNLRDDPRFKRLADVLDLFHPNAVSGVSARKGLLRNLVGENGGNEWV